MIDCELFIKQFYPAANAVYKDDIKRFINNLDKLIGTLPLRVALTDKQLLCSSFYLQRTANGISRSHYQKIKAYLINLFNFAGISEYDIIPSRAEVIQSQEISSYYPSLSALLTFIDKIGTLTLKTCDTTNDLARVKSVCILGWLGLTIKEIAELKITDLKLLKSVDNDAYNEYEIRVGNKVYSAYDEAFTPLYILQTLDSYNGLPSGRKIFFKGDEQYLFRATNESDCHDGNTIRKIIQRFDYCIPFTEKKSIVFRTLNKNRLFLELYNDSSINSCGDNTRLVQKVMDLMNCDRVSAYACLEQYQIFATMLKNNKL